MKLSVGDGYIELLDSMGDDLAIVNAARVSYNRESKEFLEADNRLLRRLYYDKHTGPFEMVELKFRVKLPLFISDQWQRHRTWSYNKISRRYTSEDISFHYPKSWRLQETKNKQSSCGEYHDQDRIMALYEESVEKAFNAYKLMIENGVCREQARMVLPQGTMTTMIAKVDGNNLLKFLKLRCSNDAQKEIREYAFAMLDLAKTVIPHTIALLEEEMVII